MTHAYVATVKKERVVVPASHKSWLKAAGATDIVLAPAVLARRVTEVMPLEKAEKLKDPPKKKAQKKEETTGSGDGDSQDPSGAGA